MISNHVDKSLLVKKRTSHVENWEQELRKKNSKLLKFATDIVANHERDLE